jgi:hypothetical protein
MSEYQHVSSQPDTPNLSTWNLNAKQAEAKAAAAGGRVFGPYSKRVVAAQQAPNPTDLKHPAD